MGCAVEDTGGSAVPGFSPLVLQTVSGQRFLPAIIFGDGSGWVRGRNGGTCEGRLVRNPGPDNTLNISRSSPPPNSHVLQ